MQRLHNATGEQVMSEASLFIAGRWLAGQGDAFTKRDPLSGEVIWTGNAASAQEVAEAVQAARQAFAPWAACSYADRVAVVERFAILLTEHKIALAETISRETSKPRWESLMEVQSMIGKAAISQQAYQQRTGEQHSALADGEAVLRHRPHGVLAVLGPYNFPGHLPNGHIIPALLAGNTLVFKPSELTPATAQATVRLWQQAGLPAGVLNLLQGGRQTGEALSCDPQLDGLLFTGSANTGRQLHRQFAGKPEKILALEMGGNNALIVEPVSDIAAAVNITLQSAFISAGQRCTCARRLLVKNGQAGDTFIHHLLTGIRQLRIGQWNDEPQPFMGGVISLPAAQHLLAAQQQLLALGGKSLLMLTQPDPGSSLLTPGVIDVTDISQPPDEEYFGPLLTLWRYDRFEQAIALANQTRFGLATGLISSQADQFQQLVNQARSGIVNWNKPLTGASSNAPFGGIGASGNHRPSAYYAADYCAWPMASLEAPQLQLPDNLLPGITLSVDHASDGSC
jgi:succinylglutamic semialdehyde dehydrogenase